VSALHEARPVGGPIVTRPFRWLALIAGIGAAFSLYRFMAGLGASTGLSDGYPWGIWIAFDVVTGTALACGGYAVAILVYILNKGQYHPLVRPAILTSALGYSLAGLAITIDVGRGWLLYRVPLYVNHWNLNSALLEVALCVMSYIAVLWIEMSPAFMEHFQRGPDGPLKSLSKTFHPIVQKILPWVIALGLLLPTMHQSSLGTVMLLTGAKLHPLWSTPILPLLFLVSCVGMGFAIVVFESTLSAALLKRPRETDMLSGLAGVVGPVLWGFAGLRLVDLLVRGQGLAIFTSGKYSLFFLVEMVLFLAPAVLLRDPGKRRDAGHLFRMSMVMILAGALYRIDSYIVAFRPGEQYSYFPTIPEFGITIGLVALEILLYVVIIKTFPILAGASSKSAPAVAER
jgi:Ni/Fe-hydrogenase subunit HybB-like protein